MIIVTQKVWQSIWYGTPLTEIQIGRPNTLERVIGKSLRQSAPSRYAEMVVRFNAGETQQQIADRFNVSRQRVQQVLKQHGLDRQSGGIDTKRFMLARDKIEQAKRRQELKERKIRTLTGMTMEQWVAHIEQYGKSSDKKSPYRKFIMQKKNAAQRSIGWEMSFAEWWSAWQESGLWLLRGRGKRYCMARYGDSGPYKLGNIMFCTGKQNSSDSYLVDHPKRPKSRGFKLQPYPVKDGERYMVVFSRPIDGKRRYAKFQSIADAEAFGCSKAQQ